MDVSLNTSREYVSKDLKNLLSEADKALEKCISDEDEVRDGDPDDGSNDCDLSKSVLNTTAMSNSSFDVTQAKCRPNPADLYSSFEAKELALDENHRGCPDHNDSCECWNAAKVPVFNLGKEFSEMEHEFSKGKEGEEVRSPHQSLRLDAIDDMNRGGWDTNFDDHSFEITANNLVADDNSCVYIGDIDLSNSFVEDKVYNARSSLNNSGNLKDAGVTSSHKVEDFFPNVTEENGNDLSFSSLHEEEFFPEQPEENVSHISYDDDDDEEVGHFMSYLPNQGTDIFNESDKPLLGPLKVHSGDTVEKDGSKPLQKKSVSRKRTIPRSPHLRTKQIFGERHYSSIGIPRVITLEKPTETSAWINRPLTVPVGPKLACEERLGSKLSPSRLSRLFRRKKDEEKDEYTMMADSNDFGDEKHGRLRDDIVPTAKVKREKFKPTVPVAPNLKLAAKNGDKKYSGVGCHKDHHEEEKKVRVKEWGKNWKPTQPFSPRFSLKKNKFRKATRTESENDDDQEKPFKFRAQPVPIGVLNSSFGALKLPKVEKKGPTIPKPFNLRTEKRSETPVPSEENDEPSYVPFRARPAPDFLHDHKIDHKVPQKAQSKVTIPKPFKLRTEERASTPTRSGSVEPSFKPFKARPVPDFLNEYKVPSKTHHVEKKKPTVPKPFKLSTEERANTPTTSEETDHSLKPFKARPVPDFTRLPVSRPKHEKKLTIPKPFRLSSEARESTRPEDNIVENDDTCSTRPSTKQLKEKCLESFRLRTDERGSKWARKKIQNSAPEYPVTFKARPMPDFSKQSIQGLKSVRPLTVPKPFKLSSFESTDSVEPDDITKSEGETSEKTDSIGTVSEYETNEKEALGASEPPSDDTSFALRSSTLAMYSAAV
jgi:hypothetical protein